MDENLNLPEEKLNANIYRIINFDRLIEILESKKNTLSRPENWDDPFEKLLSIVSVDGDYDMPVKNFGKYIYAQCWTFSEENDLLWRVYSPERDGVRIRSTPSRLLNSLKKSSTIQAIEQNPKILEEFAMTTVDETEFVETPEGERVPIMNTIKIQQVIQPFIGQVEYLTIKEIWNYLDRINGNSNYYDLIRSILIKREPFKNEEEIRFGIYNLDTLEQTQITNSNSRFNYEFNVNETFEEIVFDPRITPTKFNGLKDLVLKLGFKNPILRSTIYDKPKPEDLDPDIDYEYLFGNLEF